MCHWRHPVPSGSLDRGALSLLVVSWQPPSYRGGLCVDSSHMTVCFLKVSRATDSIASHMSQRLGCALSLEENQGPPHSRRKGSQRLRNAGRKGSRGPPSSLSTVLPKPSSASCLFSLPHFLVVWVIYILTFLLTPVPSQQRLELTTLRVLPRDEPRSFNS